MKINFFLLWIFEIIWSFPEIRNIFIFYYRNLVISSKICIYFTSLIVFENLEGNHILEALLSLFWKCSHCAVLGGVARFTPSGNEGPNKPGWSVTWRVACGWWCFYELAVFLLSHGGSDCQLMRCCQNSAVYLWRWCTLQLLYCVSEEINDKECGQGLSPVGLFCLWWCWAS